jgi:Arc/MetJ-type ribon-helix-helix transcriptional regulator
MTPFSIDLPEPLIHYIQEQITAEQYSTASEYIQFLIQQDQLQNAHRKDFVLGEGKHFDAAESTTM